MKNQLTRQRPRIPDIPGIGVSVSCAPIGIRTPDLRFVGFVLAAYIGSVGVRYQWCEQEIPDEQRSQFFDYLTPVANRFVDEDAVARGEVGRRGLLDRLSGSSRPQNYTQKLRSRLRANSGTLRYREEQ